VARNDKDAEIARLREEIRRLRALCGRARACMVEHEVDADITTDDLMDELYRAAKGEA